jgi:CheY-like chemotaxis protein
MAGFADAVFHEVSDGAEAISFCEDNHIDLILSDIKMPKMDGITFIKKIHLNEATKETPIVIISSVADNAAKDQLTDDRIKAVIQKPLSPAKVVKALEGQ